MSTPIPPPASMAPMPVQVSTPMTVTLPNPPQALMSLPQGTTLNATVLATLTKGEARISTEFGELVLKTPLNLPQGGDVALTLLGQVRGQAILKIAALNGRPITGAAPPGFGAGQGGALGGGAGIGGGGGLAGAGSGSGLSASNQGATGGGQAQAVTVTLGSSATSGIAATVVRAAAGPISLGLLEGGAGGGIESVPAPPQGAQLIVRVAQVTPPPGGGAGPAGGTSGPMAAAPTVSPLGASGVPGAAPAPGAAVPSGGGAGPNRGEAGQGRSEGRVAEAAGGSPPVGGARMVPNGTLRALVGRIVPGTVLSSGGGAQPVIDTDIGQLALRARLDARPGDLVQLQIMGRPASGFGASTGTPPLAPPPMAGAGQAGQGPLPLTGGTGWPTLSESLRVMATTEGGGANNPLLAVMPKPGPFLAAAVTTFVGALRGGGDTEKWPGGPAMRGLEQTGGKKGAELAKRLGSDMRDMASRSTEGSGEWRSYTVPFLGGADIDPIRVILRRQGGDGEDGEDGGKGRGEQGQRFLVEVDLSRLGPLQFDGLYKKKGRALDMMVRARDPLPPPIRHDIHVLYNAALVTMGLAGRLQFDFTGAFVRPPVPSPSDDWRGGGEGPGPGGVIV
ncbi:MAG: hypothetical protein K9H25_13100 [Rhodospirillum sp.]|nr:hypothetical protein [Rhodospirillum sp.]